MTSRFEFDGHTVEMSREVDLLDVTSLSRPDLAWRFVDAHGHVHVWADPSGVPATRYSVEVDYVVPTVVKVDDEPEYDEDGEEIPVWHYECSQCRELVEPGYRADTERQFIAGMRRQSILIDGLPATINDVKKLVGEAWPQ